MLRLAFAASLALLVAPPSARAQDEPTLGVSTEDATGARGGEEQASVADDRAQDASGADAGGGLDASDEAARDEGAASDEEEDLFDDEASDAGEVSEVAAPMPRWTDERAGAWAMLAASFGVAVLGGALLAAGADEVNAIENAPDGTVWEEVAGARSRAPLLTGLGAAFLALGAAGSAVGAALVSHFGEGGTWIGVSALPGGVSVQGRF